MINYPGMTELPVVIATENNVQTLRFRQPGDAGNKDVFATWLFFRKTQEDHISVNVEMAFHVDFLIGLYKDNVFEWSSFAMYGMQIHADIACYLATHCESLVDSPDISKDYISYPDEEEPLEPRMATSGDLAGRFAERVFETVWSSCFPVVGANHDPIERSLAATQSLLGLLAGRQSDFPRMELVVAQNKAEEEYRRLQGGESFRDGTRVRVDATQLMDVVNHHSLVKAWLNLKD